MNDLTNDITVEKLDGQGRVVVAYRGAVRERFAGGLRLEARWELPARDLGYTRFEPGDRFIEWFYTDRWYNIFEIHAATTGTLRGWYCNVAAPARLTDATVSCRDLLLDLWVAPDGTARVLDEDEFAADTTLDPPTRAAALAALAALRALVDRRAPPFDAIAPA
ncbi:MAG TPA: DUF402 domain-containing protein [Ktedonobacterales bacterium]